ncbi:unnamed protein product [Cylicostephanus goldi]|uniref:Galectin n=1 Tax=Cylicostephanus goldi TaxID=71465 RepID=A0A3P6TPT4_CYLGO|nr:unnamed protein product [Cylicostephanus goldi]
MGDSIPRWKSASGYVRSTQDPFISYSISILDPRTRRSVKENTSLQLVLVHGSHTVASLQIIRNSYKGGIWGNEEREGPFPFEKNHGFDLKIENEPYSIQTEPTVVLHIDSFSSVLFQKTILKI